MMNHRIVEIMNDQLNMLNQDDYYLVVEHVFFQIVQEMFELKEIVVDVLQVFDLLINKMNKTKTK